MLFRSVIKVSRAPFRFEAATKIFEGGLVLCAFVVRVHLRGADIVIEPTERTPWRVRSGLFRLLFKPQYGVLVRESSEKSPWFACTLSARSRIYGYELIVCTPTPVSTLPKARRFALVLTLILVTSNLQGQALQRIRQCSHGIRRGWLGLHAPLPPAYQRDRKSVV